MRFFDKLFLVSCIISGLLSLVLIFFLCGCGAENDGATCPAVGVWNFHSDAAGIPDKVIETFPVCCTGEIFGEGSPDYCVGESSPLNSFFNDAFSGNVMRTGNETRMLLLGYEQYDCAVDAECVGDVLFKVRCSKNVCSFQRDLPDEFVLTVKDVRKEKCFYTDDRHLVADWDVRYWWDDTCRGKLWDGKFCEMRRAVEGGAERDGQCD